MPDRNPPKKMAQKIARQLKKQNPDANYVKKVFAYVREELGMRGQAAQSRKLPELLTEEEIRRFYETVWKTNHRVHTVMLKLLIYTGVRNSELANFLVGDVNLHEMNIRVSQGKGSKDRYVPFPTSFAGELGQYIQFQRERKAQYLFETQRRDRFSTRWIRKIVKRYAQMAGIEKRIYPHLFRHQLLTHLARKGILDTKVQVLSGHESRQSLAIYQKLSLGDVAEEYQEAMRDFPIG